MTTPRSMFEGGLGLPVMAIGWSVVISFAGCWAWLETAHFWKFLASFIDTGQADTALLSEGYVGYFIAAAFALLAQWTANFVVLRIRRGQSRWLWASYAICALYAAVSLHHVHEAMAAPAWRAQVEARTTARAPDLTIIEANDRFINEARSRTLGLSTDTVSRRNESVSGPLSEAMTAAAASNADARARLAEVPALPDQRPLNWVDFIVGMIAAALALLEFTLYWGIGGAPRALAVGVAPAADTDVAKGAEPETAKGEVVELRPADKGNSPVKVVPETIMVGTIAFERNTHGRALLDELEKAGLIDRSSIWSKVNSYPRNGAHKKAA